MDAEILQQIRDRILNVSGVSHGGMATELYLQQIRDAILSVTGGVFGCLNEAIYLQQIRDAILGVTSSPEKYGNLASHVYLQQIRDAYLGVTSNPVGSLDEDIYLAEILPIASGGDTTAPTCTITSTATSPVTLATISVTITFSEVVTGFVVGDITAAGCTLANFATSDSQTYTVDATFTANTMTLDIAAGVCTDAAGNANLAATQFSRNREYRLKVLSYSPLAYWPLYEASGIICNDIAGNAHNGTYSNVTLAQTGIGDGRTSASFNGTSSFADVFSAGLAAVFPSAAGSLLVWVKVAAAGVWSDGAARALAAFYATINSSDVHMNKAAGANLLRTFYYAGGTSSNVDLSTSSTAWICFVQTWDKVANQYKLFVNGSQVGTTQAIPGTWSGALAVAVIGALSTAPVSVWSGNIAHAALFGAVLTPTQITDLYSVPT